jgi:hypothetical protein
MNMRDKKDGGGTLTLVEAVETLSTIADLEWDHNKWQHNIGVVNKYDMIVQGKPFSCRTVDWLHQKGADGTVKMVKEVFRVILNYLTDFYGSRNHAVQDDQVLEGIKTIMVLVGEAAKKLDKYTEFFQQTREKSVTELKEYRKLQEFYQSRIARRIDEGTLVQWIYALSRKQQKDKGVKLVGKASGQIKHVFMDLEGVKKDLEYELFFLRKEDGSRFFNPRLVRNLKLVNDFGTYFGELGEGDSFSSLSAWKDKYAYACATSILRACRVSLEKFYQRALRHKDNDLVEALNKCLLALFLCSNPAHLVRTELSPKTCSGYFYDFQFFLRQALYSRDYQHMVAYPPRKTSQLSHCLMNLTHALCMSLYTKLSGLRELMPAVRDLVHEAEQKRSLEHTKACQKSYSIADRIACDYAALAHLMKKHSRGPIDKILNALEEGDYKAFDPLIHGNIPCDLYTLYIQHSKCRIMRWPCPIQQEFIHKGSVVQEFKTFLRSCSHDPMINKCLVFNLQDRTSWKEHCRALAIEDLPEHESYARHIEVVSLSKDTEFYHQLTPYHQDHRADIFMQVYKEQLLDEGCGFFFPEKMKRVLEDQFIPHAMEAVHRIFFGGKNVLTREQRLDFIEIFSLFLALKVIDCVKPDVASFMCKDGVDSGQAAAIELYVFLKLLNQERLSEHDREHLDALLYGPSLLFRERLMLPERFNRMLSVIKTLESVKNELGHVEFVKSVQIAFKGLYMMPLLSAKPVF